MIKVDTEIFATKEHLIWFEAQFFALNLKLLWFITDLSEFRHEFNKTKACFCDPRVIWPFQELAIFIFHQFFFFRGMFCFLMLLLFFFCFIFQWHLCENLITETSFILIFSLNWDLGVVLSLRHLYSTK